jgi:hypothetical protein
LNLSFHCGEHLFIRVLLRKHYEFTILINLEYYIVFNISDLVFENLYSLIQTLILANNQWNSHLKIRAIYFEIIELENGR